MAAYYVQEERAASQDERLAVRGQAACNAARLRTAGTSAGTRKFAGATGITNDDAFIVRVGIGRHDGTRNEILRGEAASSSSSSSNSCARANYVE